MMQSGTSVWCPGPASVHVHQPLGVILDISPLFFFSGLPWTFVQSHSHASSSVPPPAASHMLLSCSSAAKLQIHLSELFTCQYPHSDDKFLEGKCLALNRQSMNGDPLFFMCFRFLGCPLPSRLCQEARSVQCGVCPTVAGLGLVVTSVFRSTCLSQTGNYPGSRTGRGSQDTVIPNSHHLCSL